MIVATNTLDMILAVARTRGCAPASQLVFRQAVVDRIAAEDGGLAKLTGCGIPYVVDETIPAFPGFEVHRHRNGRSSW